MKRFFAVLACLILYALQPARATQYIKFDAGGEISDYVTKYIPWKFNSESVIIDGLCASACTIVLGAVPMANICVTQKAVLGFHSAWSHKKVVGKSEIKIKGKGATFWL